MSAASDFARLRSLPPAEAIAYMQGRVELGETYHWADLWHGEHARAFAVSRLANADLLGTIRDSITKSVAGDLTRRDWMKDTAELLRNTGWWGQQTVIDPRTGEEKTTRFDAARLQLIYDTNTRQAAAAGQWDRMQRHRRTHPYARYVSMDDGRVRPLHRAWHGVVLPIDDAWWDTHRPPNGWRCRCRVVGVTQREYDAGQYKERPGAQDDTAAPLVQQPMKKGRPEADGDTVDWQNPQTGEVQQVPRGIDPGFAYNAGTPQARSEAFNALVQRKLEAMAPKVRAEAVKAGWYPPGINQPQLEAWRAMVAKMAGKEHGTGQTLQVHALDTDTAQAMKEQGITLQERAVWVKDSDLAHAMRDTKADRSADIPEWVWRDLPVLLQGATPYLDTEKTALVYGLDLGERWGKVVVQVNYSSKGRFEGVRATKVSNFMSTGGLVEPGNLQKDSRYMALK